MRGLFATVTLGCLILGGCEGVSEGVSEGVIDVHSTAQAGPASDADDDAESQALLGPQVSAGDPLVELEMLLQDRRSALTFAPQTPEQRKRAAEKAKLVFEQLYVNRQAKEDFYQPQTAVLGRLDRLVASAEYLTDALFQTELHDIFTSQRDNHLTFQFAKPLACFESTLPVLFRDALDAAKGKRVVGVEFVNVYRDLTRNMQALSEIHVGDVLVSYDGQPIDLALERLGIEASAANDSGLRARGIVLLAFRPHFITLVPNENSAVLGLEREDGSRYTVVVPWISELAPGCLDAAPSSEPGLGSPSEAHDGSMAVDLFTLKYQDWLSANRAAVAQPRELRNRDAAGGAPQVELLRHADENMFTATKLTTAQGKLAVLEIRHFLSALDIDPALNNIANVLTQLNDTKAMLIDVRQNYGGIAEIAEAMAKFFSAGPIAIGGARLLNSPLNERLVAAMFAGTVFDTAFQQAKASGAAFTEPAPMINADFVNRSFAHAYTKPVVILTDGLCYSACDIFTATMQDNALATIYGLDRTTGAGGATVLDTAFVVEQLAAEPPFDAASPVMSFAHRQFVRGGRNAGKLLEDFGVEREREAFILLSELRAELNWDIALRERMLGELELLAP